MVASTVAHPWYGMVEVCEGAPVAVSGWVMSTRSCPRNRKDLLLVGERPMGVLVRVLPVRVRVPLPLPPALQQVARYRLTPTSTRLCLLTAAPRGLRCPVAMCVCAVYVTRGRAVDSCRDCRC